jgi:hypothetical protein
VKIRFSENRARVFMLIAAASWRHTIFMTRSKIPRTSDPRALFNGLPVSRLFATPQQQSGGTKNSQHDRRWLRD